MWTWWVSRSSSAPVSRSDPNTPVHSSNGSQFKIAPVDPGDRQAQRLAADHVGVLRLAGVQNLRNRHASVGDQVAEEGPARLVDASPFSRTYEIDAAGNRGRL